MALTTPASKNAVNFVFFFMLCFCRMLIQIRVTDDVQNEGGQVMMLSVENTLHSGPFHVLECILDVTDGYLCDYKQTRDKQRLLRWASAEVRSWWYNSSQISKRFLCLHDFGLLDQLCEGDFCL